MILSYTKDKLLLDSNSIQTHKHSVRKRTLHHLAKFGKVASVAKLFSVCLRNIRLWIRIPLLSLKLADIIPRSSKEFLDIQEL